VHDKSDLSIDHFDVIQNKMSDCWLLSAFSTIANSTKLIDRIIIHNDDVKGVTIFNLLGHQIMVDHFVPVLIKHDGESEILAPKVSKQNESWPILLEKCFIKIMGSHICPFEIKTFNSHRRIRKGINRFGPDYVDIQGGFPRWALGILFNFKFHPIQTKYVDLEKALCCEKGQKIVGCAMTSLERNDSFQDQGFVYGHAYSILYCTKNLIRVRNPWGTVESTKYDDNGTLNGNCRKDDGEFFVDFDDFRERFPMICFVKLDKYVA
jgi:hypothetical protein